MGRNFLTTAHVFCPGTQHPVNCLHAWIFASEPHKYICLYFLIGIGMVYECLAHACAAWNLGNPLPMSDFLELKPR